MFDFSGHHVWPFLITIWFQAECVCRVLIVQAASQKPTLSVDLSRWDAEGLQASMGFMGRQDTSFTCVFACFQLLSPTNYRQVIDQTSEF